MVLASAVVVMTRPDVVRLDPLTLRVDNWRTAVAVWREAPVAGVGFGGFGQAAQTVHLELGNRPAHAHSVVGEGLAELGPLGACVSILVLMAVARVAWRLRLEDSGLSASMMVVSAPSPIRTRSAVTSRSPLALSSSPSPAIASS